MEDSVRVTVEFGGGTELLLAPPHARVHIVSLPSKDHAPDMRTLVQYIRQHLIKEREELFVENDHMYVVNTLTQTDWELEGEMDYELHPNDHIVFISTLHGG